MMKYLAAAKGGKNVAAQGSAGVASTVSRSGVGRKPLSAASGAGYESHSSAYIGMRGPSARAGGSGYQPGPKPKTNYASSNPPAFYKPNLPPRQRVADMTRRQLTTDEQLSNLL